MQRQTLEMSPKEELQFRMDQSEKDMLIKHGAMTGKHFPPKNFLRRILNMTTGK